MELIKNNSLCINNLIVWPWILIKTFIITNKKTKHL